MLQDVNSTRLVQPIVLLVRICMVPMEFSTMPPPLDIWQYRISYLKTPRSVAAGPMWLEVGPDLPVTHVYDAGGTEVGLLLGFPIDLETRKLITRNWRVSLSLGDDPDKFVESVLERLGGRFLWVFCTDSLARVYPDISAQIPCVFDPGLQFVGSTAHALWNDDEYQKHFDSDLFDRLGIDGEGWFPAGCTAHGGLMRLLPNHYLDLLTWNIHRFHTGPVVTTTNPTQAVNEIIEIVQSQIEALMSGSKRVAIALTAGRETRMLLACARPYLDKVDFVTVTGGDQHSMDTVLAQRIARDHNLSHISLSRTLATPLQKDLFVRRGGHCNSDSNALFHPSVWPIAETHQMVSGVGGEIARAFFWRASDRPRTPLSASALSDRFGLPSTKVVGDALEEWLSQLEGISALRVLDLAYLEHRDGAWYAPQFCSDPTLVRQAPLLTRRSVDLMMSLPNEWKRSNRLSEEIVKQLWPELASYPYNSLGAWRDLRIKLQRGISNPSLIIKKLRKMRR